MHRVAWKAWAFSVVAVVSVALALPGGAALSRTRAATTPNPVVATVGPNTLSPGDLAAATVVDHANVALQFTYASLRARTLTDADLKARIADIQSIQARLSASLTVLTRRSKDLESRLAQLGPAPAAGQPAEAAETAANRQALTRSLAAIETEVKQARLLNVEASQLERSLSARLRSNFSARLWARDRSVLDLGLWRDFAAALPADVGKLGDAVKEEGATFSQAIRARGAALSLILAILAALALLGPARFLLDRFSRRRVAESAEPSSLRRAALALALVLVASLTPLAAGEVLRGALIGMRALTPSFILITGLLIRVVVFAMVLESLGRALLSPSRPAWRLAPMSDKAARRIAPYPGIVGAAVGFATLVGSLNTAFDTSLPSSIASVCVVVLLEVAAVGAALLALGGVRLEEASEVEAAEPRGVKAPWVLAALAAWLAIVAALVAVLFGYLALAGFLTRETVWVATILAAFFLLVRFTDEVFPALLSPASPAGRAIERAVGLSASAREQIGVLLAGAARVVFLLAGWAAVVAPFGADPDGLATHLTGTKLVLHLGKATVSPGAIAGALALFLLGVLVTRAVRGWFEKHYLPKTSLDVGLRTSVGAGLSYLGVLVAVLVAFASLGLSFSQIALFASALSVGIGFGLQAIIGNFVSGLILLAERPVQIGDWIAIGDLEGDVRRISIRATEIEMLDKSRLIVPNSDLVSKTVRNVTHGGAIGRVKIVLKVNDTADPAAVRDVLLGRIEANEHVLKDPAASVFLTNVADGAMEFSLFAYVDTPRAVTRVKSELLFAIVPELAGRGIDLANSTPIVNVGFRGKAIESDAPPSTSFSPS